MENINVLSPFILLISRFNYFKLGKSSFIDAEKIIISLVINVKYVTLLTQYTMMDKFDFIKKIIQSTEALYSQREISQKETPKIV